MAVFTQAQKKVDFFFPLHAFFLSFYDKENSD